MSLLLPFIVQFLPCNCIHDTYMWGKVQEYSLFPTIAPGFILFLFRYT